MNNCDIIIAINPGESEKRKCNSQTEESVLCPGYCNCITKTVKQSRYRSGVAQRFQEVKVTQSRYRPGVAQRFPAGYV
jgi:hypothetical protein